LEGRTDLLNIRSKTNIDTFQTILKPFHFEFLKVFVLNVTFVPFLNAYLY